LALEENVGLVTVQKGNKFVETGEEFQAEVGKMKGAKLGFVLYMAKHK
jgi:hypothetical protein